MNKTPIICTVLVVSLKTTMKKSGYDVRNVSDGRAHFLLVWKKILFVSLIRDKHCFFSQFVSFVFELFAFCKYYLCFLCKLFTSPN